MEFGQEYSLIVPVLQVSFSKSFSKTRERISTGISLSWPRGGISSCSVLFSARPWSCNVDGQDVYVSSRSFRHAWLSLARATESIARARRSSTRARAWPFENEKVDSLSSLSLSLTFSFNVLLGRCLCSNVLVTVFW